MRSYLLALLLLPLQLPQLARAQELARGQVLRAIDPPRLPLPLSPGGSCSFVVPCARSEDLAGHLRGALLVMDAGRDTRPAVHFGISVSLWRWAEWGAAWYASFGNSPAGLDLRQGPISLWGRFSTPRGLLSRDKEQGLFLAAQAQHDVARGDFSQGGRLFPDASTLTAVVEYRKWRIHAAASAALQFADGTAYKGVQAGGGLWLTLFKSLQIGGEILGRAGALEGEPEGRTAYLAVLGARFIDEYGTGGGLAYLRGDGQEIPQSSFMGSFSWSVGKQYKRPPASRPPLTQQDFWWLFGYRDPIVGADGWIWSDDGKRRLGQYGNPHPSFISPLLGRHVLRVGDHVLWRPRDGAIRHLVNGNWEWAGYSHPGLHLNQGRAIDDAVAQGVRPPVARPPTWTGLARPIRRPLPGEMPPLSWYRLRDEPGRVEPARGAQAPPPTWTPPAPFNFTSRPQWSAPGQVPPELRGAPAGVRQILFGPHNTTEGCFNFTERPQWSTPRPEPRPGPYDHLKPPRTIAPGKEPTRMQRRLMYGENEGEHGGKLRDDYTGEALVRPQQSKKGVTPPDNEAQIDHVRAAHPQAGQAPGTNAYPNLRITSRRYNRLKSNRPPTIEELKR